MGVGDREMRHDPAKNCGTLPCSATPATPMPSSTAWSITPTGSISTARACGEPVNPAERPEQVALWTCRCAWTTQEHCHMPTAGSSRRRRPSSRDSRLTKRLRRCQKPDSQNASRPGRHHRNGGRDHLGMLGEIKSVHPGEIIGISRLAPYGGWIALHSPYVLAMYDNLPAGTPGEARF